MLCKQAKTLFKPSVGVSEGFDKIGEKWKS